MNTPRVEISDFNRGLRKDVFTARVNPKITTQWRCPEWLEVVSFSIDAKVGGEFHHVMNGEPGTFRTSGVYQEIILNERLVFLGGFRSKKIPIRWSGSNFQIQDGGT